MMAPEDKDRETDESVPATEISETRYMGEGPPDGQTQEDAVEMSETAYMGEPEERHEPKHETEYNKGRVGPKMGKATLEVKHEKGERKSA